MYNHNKAQQSKNRVHISWDILYIHAHEKYLCCMQENGRRSFAMTAASYLMQPVITQCITVAWRYINVQNLRQASPKIHTVFVVSTYQSSPSICPDSALITSGCIVEKVWRFVLYSDRKNQDYVDWKRKFKCFWLKWNTILDVKIGQI